MSVRQPGSGAPVLRSLALQVNLDDRVRVDDSHGVSTTGRLTRRIERNVPDAPIVAGALGAGLGLGAGALMPRTTIYPEANRRVLVVPVISRDAFGFWITRQW